MTNVKKNVFRKYIRALGLRDSEEKELLFSLMTCNIKNIKLFLNDRNIEDYRHIIKKVFERGVCNTLKVYFEIEFPGFIYPEN